MKIIIANQKNNLSFDEIDSYLDKLKNKDLNNVIFCPTSLYTTKFIENNLKVGIQNFEDETCTGEISIKQIKKLNINYVILGHSERKRILKETNKYINNKLKIALKNNLKCILCIGDESNFEEEISKQLDELLLDIDDLENITLAYEPIKSIGTNNILSLDILKENICFIKNYIQNKYHFDIKVLYGGSVNINNIKSLNKINNIDGFLIGNASLNVEEFLKIIEIVDN